MSALFGDAVVDMTGHVEGAADFIKERHNVDSLHLEVAYNDEQHPDKV